MASNLRSCTHCRALVDRGEAVCPYCGGNLAARSFRPVTLAPASYGAITSYLIGTCVLLFGLEAVASLGSEGSKGIWMALVSVPGDVLVQMGARYGPLITAGEWWRLVVPIFLHGNLLHLLFNGMALAQVGPLAEQAYGRARYLILFVVTGVLGNVFAISTFGYGVLSIGASGALFGLIGATAVYGHRRGGDFGRMIRRVMIQWAIYALLFGFLAHADNLVHFGGLVAGAALSFVIGDAERRPRGLDRLWGGVAWVVMIVTIAALAMAVYAYAVYGRGGGGG